MSVTSVGEAVSKKQAPWKGVLRLVVAVVLVGVLAWIVPVRDRLTWSARFGPAPLAGRIVDAVDRLEFHVESGERAGQTIVVTRAELEAPAKGGEPKVEEGLKTTVMRLARSPLAFVEAVLLYLLGGMLSFQRWHVLLRAIHVDARGWRVQKLGFLGLFFSNIIPGMTGGDLVKAIMVARDHPEQRPAAVLSVIVDRAIGLLGLALVASGALLFQHGRFEGMAWKLNVILGGIVVAAVVVMSKRLRRAIGLDRLLRALPFSEVLQKLDHAALRYREARGTVVYAVLVSLAIHGMVLTAIAVLGRALGVGVAFLDYYALAPLALIAQSLPISPGGVGVGELAFVGLFKKAGVAAAPALALSLSYRVVQLLVSLIGGLLLLVGHEAPVSSTEMASEASEE